MVQLLRHFSAINGEFIYCNYFNHKREAMGERGVSSIVVVAIVVVIAAVAVAAISYVLLIRRGIEFKTFYE
jgi:hypothetical protein